MKTSKRGYRIKFENKNEASVQASSHEEAVSIALEMAHKMNTRVLRVEG